ncbi:MAG TPA: hypothetical protein P5277_01495 [Candidatus Paceibacterota bacterium]|nr:hypothetical protein [Candidatus Paceibacterota bacterium]
MTKNYVILEIDKNLIELKYEEYSNLISNYSLDVIRNMNPCFVEALAKNRDIEIMLVEKRKDELRDDYL